MSSALENLAATRALLSGAQGVPFEPLSGLKHVQAYLSNGISTQEAEKIKAIQHTAAEQGLIDPTNLDEPSSGNNKSGKQNAAPATSSGRPTAPSSAQVSASIDTTAPIRSGKIKKCAKCGLVKPLEEFGSNSTSSDGRQTYCRPCKNHLNTLKRQNDMDHRIKHHIATRVAKQLEGNLPPNYTQNLEQYLGYKIWQLRKALENDLAFRGLTTLRETFRMNWHLDHYKPLSSYNVKSIDSQEFKDCWAISNLRMIPAAENLAKSNKILEDTCNQQVSTGQ